MSDAEGNGSSMRIKRYQFTDVRHIQEAADGNLVAYDDHAAEVERLQARERQLEALVRELADDVSQWVTKEYDGTLHHPGMKRRYERDMDVVARALATVSAEKEGGPGA